MVPAGHMTAEEKQAIATRRRREREAAVRSRQERDPMPLASTGTGGAPAAKEGPSRPSEAVPKKSAPKRKHAVEVVQTVERKRVKPTRVEVPEVVSPPRSGSGTPDVVEVGGDDEAVTKERSRPDPKGNGKATASDSGRPFYFDKKLLADPTVMNCYREELFTGLTNVSDLPDFSTSFHPSIRRSIGELLARRVSATDILAQHEPSEIMHQAASDLGMAAHVVSTGIFRATAALDNHADMRRRELQEREAELTRLSKKAQDDSEKLEELAEQVASQEKINAILQSDLAEKAKRITELEEKLRPMLRLLSGPRLQSATI